MRAQYKINKIESKSNKNKESSNARTDDIFRKIFASDLLTWIQYCFPNITRPGTGHEKARTSCNVKNREQEAKHDSVHINFCRFPQNSATF